MKSQIVLQLIANALNALDRHPRRVMGGLAALLLGTGVTAFGVAPQLPDPAEQPVRTVIESVQPLSVPQQTEVLLGHRFNLYRTEVTRSTDTADSLLARLSINDPQAAAFLRKDELSRDHVLRGGARTVTAEANDDQQLVKLSVRWATGDQNFFKRLVVERQGNGFFSRVETAAYSRSTRLASGAINKSLESSFEKAGLGQALAEQVTSIFSSEIDFSNAVLKGDRFSVYYEVLEADGEPLRAGRILAAEIVHAGQAHQAMWFRHEGHPAQGQAKAGGGAYYSLDGKSMVRGYLLPLESGTLTSGFSMRMNPLLNRMQAHNGVDYAAPPGTPVRAVADGRVEFAGSQNGYGNVVFIDHGKGHTTVYAHLSSIAVSRGQRVSQGQHLGGVGSTGWATGPHLHFEFRINGVHQDPAQIARKGSAGNAIAASALPAFRQSASLMRQQLSAAATLQQTLAQ